MRGHLWLEIPGGAAEKTLGMEPEDFREPLAVANDWERFIIVMLRLIHIAQ
jgi:hypothetical protein